MKLESGASHVRDLHPWRPSDGPHNQLRYDHISSHVYSLIIHFFLFSFMHGIQTVKSSNQLIVSSEKRLGQRFKGQRFFTLRDGNKDPEVGGSH